MTRRINYTGVGRASIKTEDDGEVVLRLKDRTGTIRLKLGANEDGSGLLLLDSNTEPGIHALSKENVYELINKTRDGIIYHRLKKQNSDKNPTFMLGSYR